MTETIKKTLKDSALARWGVLIIVSAAMMFGYFITDVISPLEKLIMSSTTEGGLGWNSLDYGWFSSAYGWFNVFFFMLFIGGIILDKLGVRLTGVLATSLMIIGTFIKFYAVSDYYTVGDFMLFGYNSQVWLAGIGFAIFGMGVEICGITVSKVIVKWFTGKELALAMGLEMAMARIGTAFALLFSAQIATAYGEISAPVLYGALGLCIALLLFITYGVLDYRYDKEAQISNESAEDDNFKLSDVKVIFTSGGFWTIALLCMMFYSAIFPFIKYATNMMASKYGVSQDLAGAIPAMLPFGTMILTPLFGTLYDRIGKGATLMIYGSILLTTVHILFSLPFIDSVGFAVTIMILLGIAFSLVPSAMWPSVPKIIPQKQLGTAYALIFYVQNIGLMLVTMLIGWVINTFSEDVNNLTPGNYVAPMLIFAGLGVCAILLAVRLKMIDKKKGYGLELPNIKK